MTTPRIRAFPMSRRRIAEQNLQDFLPTCCDRHALPAALVGHCSRRRTKSDIDRGQIVQHVQAIVDEVGDAQVPADRRIDRPDTAEMEVILGNARGLEEAVMGQPPRGFSPRYARRIWRPGGPRRQSARGSAGRGPRRSRARRWWPGSCGRRTRCPCVVGTADDHPANVHPEFFFRHGLSFSTLRDRPGPVSKQ